MARLRCLAQRLAAKPKRTIPGVFMTAAAAILADFVEARAAGRGPGPLMVGLCGAQGSGKSTASRDAAAALTVRGLSCLVLSLDDLYLGKAARAELAAEVHPLLATRGPPGTHDVAL